MMRDENTYYYFINDKLMYVDETMLYDGIPTMPILVAIDIPDNVTTIGYRSFAGCSKLSKVKMSGKISLIDENAFEGCVLIEEIEMPSTLEEIGSYAFAGCEKLKKISFCFSRSALSLT